MADDHVARGRRRHRLHGFAKFRIFESYSTMHAYLGRDAIRFMRNDMWYDVVIPIPYDLDDFQFQPDKDEYFLFVGRVNAGKGIHIALQIAEDRRLIVAGPGEIGDNKPRTSRPISEYVELVGVVGAEERNCLLAKAKAVLAPSCFLEPFCSVNIEAMLCGTPVISTDWGAFAEYNLHGITGFRCRTFEQFTWSARNVDIIDPHACREWAERNFSLAKVGDMYEEYFASIHAIFRGDGWYMDNPERTNLDWLKRHYPGVHGR
jgi:glycosyltransferase involved in cell wall biosynthesis